LSRACKTIQKAIDVSGYLYWGIMCWRGVGDKSALAAGTSRRLRRRAIPP